MLVLLAGCLLGLVVLLVAADQLVLGSARVAAWLRVPPTVVGIAVIGFGTSAPELVASGLAAAAGKPGLAIGTIIGSNIANLTLVLGSAGLVGVVTLSQALVGATVVAVGTSAPELLTAVQAARRGEAELLVGNVLGSNLFNSLASPPVRWSPWRGRVSRSTGRLRVWHWG